MEKTLIRQNAQWNGKMFDHLCPRDIMDNLRLVGYDRVLSIEHEDSLMSVDEGLSKAIDCLILHTHWYRSPDRQKKVR